ncbi:ROK family transcriptional regulator [Pelagibius sp. Alg239-R121]|uniref:ROK family transcriptional regulator n=1 Tax=Pelagibius sp. Alg239-R121 TaxID=2993448 RepID=UPI0024A651D7|nr:ROK family transcriptional regulator [Pelagibius sp. Alg239-R121]
MSIVALDFSRQDVKLINRRLVLSEIILNGPLARTEISQRTGLTNASVSRISREFIEAGLVTEGESLPAPNRPGRRFVTLDVNPKGGYVLGISINAFQQTITLADVKNRAVARRELSLADFADPNDVLARVAEAALDIIREAEVPKGRIFGGSIAVAGAVNPDAGTVLHASSMGWKNVEIGSFLSQALEMPIHVESIPNAVNLAETRFGIGRGHHSVVLFNASLGIGGSLLLDNRLLRGKDFSAGLVYDVGLWRDAKGQRLTVNEVAGGWGVLRHMDVGRRPSPDAPLPSAASLIEAMDAANGGNDSARTALTKAGQSLADLVETVTEILHPEMVIVSGPLVNSPQYVEGLRAAIDGIWPRDSELDRLRISAMTSQAAARWLAINEFLLCRDIDLSQLDRTQVA